MEKWAMASVAAAALDLAASSCSVAAEFKKAKMNDMKLDGKFCSLPRTPAFVLGLAALICISVSQMLRAFVWMLGGFSINKCQTIMIVFSWICFILAMILLATGSSMNNWQRYGQGWMDGNCYVIRTGEYLGAAALIVVNLVMNLSSMCSSTRQSIQTQCCSGEDDEKVDEQKQGEV
ncbi:uncharacterized protein A4U43_C01F11810 [Asparagus officinalis]|uniref:Uncharacterized protein n=1 Tax=Asparagus officinalis TaxID=4686 RepID=A0A5P1FSE8_ASPOF|nr:uncharacterized protein LOC109821708 [Asparagus officinalis]ONK79919.1 uncharacterized protein A4U43_C01F11810 [Asparagus officinalis]